MPNPTNSVVPASLGAGGGGGVWTQVGATLTASNDPFLSVTGLDDSDGGQYQLRLSGIVPQTDGQVLNLEFFSSSVSKGSVAVTNGGVGSDTGEHTVGFIDLFDLASTSLTAMGRSAIAYIFTDGLGVVQERAQVATDQTAIDEVRISFAAGNIVSGTLALFKLTIA